MYLAENFKTVSDSHKENLISEIKSWSQVDQVTFLIKSMNSLSLSMVKYFLSATTDLAEKLKKSDQINILEEQANNIRYFQLLNEQPLEKKLKTVISYLPLVDHKNPLKEQLGNWYFNLIIGILESCKKQNCNLVECRYIVQMAVYHPLFDDGQKVFFKKWSDLLEENILGINSQSTVNQDASNNAAFNDMIVNKFDSNLSLNDKSAETNYSNTESSEFTYLDYDNSNFSEKIDESKCTINSGFLVDLNSYISSQHKPLMSTNSLPPFSPFKSLQNIENNYLKFANKVNNFSTNSISNDFSNSNEFFGNFNKSQALLNEFSEEKIDFSRNKEAKSIYYWLKTLRLHKYSNILCLLSYDDLMNLTDEKLISHDITLGARRKIIQNIEKLKQRNDKLDEITNKWNENSVVRNNCVLKELLEEMYQISLTPMKPQNSPPTSLADLSQIQNGSFERQKFGESEVLCSKIIKFLQKTHNHLLKEKELARNCSGEFWINSEGWKELTELIGLFLTIIDKLFLTKSFTDYQNKLLSDMRNSFNEKDFKTIQNSRSKSPLNYVQTNNSLNARLRIQNKKKVDRTSSAPFNNGIFDRYKLERDHFIDLKK